VYVCVVAVQVCCHVSYLLPKSIFYQVELYAVITLFLFSIVEKMFSKYYILRALIVIFVKTVI